MFQRLRVAVRSRDSRAAVIPMASAKPRRSRLAWFWHGMGQDSAGMIYLAIGDAREIRDGCGNVHLFQYDPATGRKHYLDSVCDILARAGNLGPNRHWPHKEGVAKVHTDIVEHNGIMYFATHDMHHPKNLRTHRGGRLMSFDPSTRQFRVLSADRTLGVAIENEGIIASGVRTQIADLHSALNDAMLTGNGVIDSSGRMYLSCYFGNDGRMFRQYGELSGLARIDVSDRWATRT